ncbi:MAG: proton extrusion protein PcxA [Cyanobacteria bacterium SW_9_44_58]|nr:MAG: proton extrusion protein PcxA [Cyanobacteria bacterium SW_9_44_58]
MYLPRVFRNLTQWFFNSPEQSLEQAYRATLMIKVIEDEYFAQEPVNPNNSSYSDQVIAYFQEEVNQNLKVAQAKLNEFKKSRSFINWSAQNFPRNKYFKNPSVILEKLNFVEEVILHYEQSEANQTEGKTKTNLRKNEIASSARVEEMAYEEKSGSLNKQEQPASGNPRSDKSQTGNNPSKQTSVLPRSLLRTFNRIKREIDPNSSEAEEEVVKTFRTSRDKTAISLRFLLILIIVPLLTHQIAKTFIIHPLAEQYWFTETQEEIFINEDFEEEALTELRNYEEKLHFKKKLGIESELSQEEIDKRVEEKAVEIAEKYQDLGENALENIIADLLSVVAFGLVIYFSREQIAVLKSFIDEFVYGLSDSAKAFIIILSTDMFVGYHSPHGWEVILEEIGRHFGLPENREFNFLFIATFPVILDTIFKYWIFRYLNRISPSAVATYRNMNE